MDPELSPDPPPWSFSFCFVRRERTGASRSVFKRGSLTGTETAVPETGKYFRVIVFIFRTFKIPCVLHLYYIGLFKVVRFEFSPFVFPSREKVVIIPFRVIYFLTTWLCWLCCTDHVTLYDLAVICLQEYSRFWQRAVIGWIFGRTNSIGQVEISFYLPCLHFGTGFLLPASLSLGGTERWQLVFTAAVLADV